MTRSDVPGATTLDIKGALGFSNFSKVVPTSRQTILREASEVALREIAKRQEMVTMQEDGVLKVLLGKTTFGEVKSVTGEISWKMLGLPAPTGHIASFLGKLEKSFVIISNLGAIPRERIKNPFI